jgi:hypothetical protein
MRWTVPEIAMARPFPACLASEETATSVRTRQSVCIVLLFASRASSPVCTCGQLGKPSVLRVVYILCQLQYVLLSLCLQRKKTVSQVLQVSSSGDGIGGCPAVALRCRGVAVSKTRLCRLISLTTPRCTFSIPPTLESLNSNALVASKH